MIDQTERLRKVLEAELDKVKLGDVVGHAIDGPAYVPTQQGLTVGWTIMVTLKHNMLIGQPDIGVTVPVMGVLPPDEVFQQGARYLLEEARKLRQQANEMDTKELTPEDIAQAAANGLGGSVPVVGNLLAGKKL